MKQKHIIILVVSFWLLFIGLFIGIISYIFIFVIKADRESISSNEFYEALSKKDFSIEDITNKHDIKGIKNIYKATNINNNYEIYFYEFDNNNDALKYYTNNYSNLASYLEMKVNTKNYNKYEIENLSGYKLISRIKNTILDTQTEHKYTSEVKAIIDELNYR